MMARYLAISGYIISDKQRRKNNIVTKILTSCIIIKFIILYTSIRNTE